MVIQRMLLLAAIAVGILAVSCSAPVAQPPAPSQPASQVPTQAAAQPIATNQSPAQTAIPTTLAAQPSATTQSSAPSVAPPRAATPTGTAKVNMNDIFPPGAGREAMLDNCTSCHTFVPMVVLQMSQSQWDRNARDHRDRVPRMSDTDFKAAYAYLAKNFNPDRPVPKLPKELLDTWTDY